VVAALDPAATGKSARPKTPGRNDQTAELPPTPNSALVPDGSGTFPPVVKNETAEPTARPDPLELPAKLLGPMPLDRGDPHMLPVIEDLPVAIVATVGDRDNLFRNLYSLWDESLSEREFAEACAIAASRDMHCLEGQAEWNELANWNRPAILELELRDGKPRPVLLQALEGDRAVVDLGFGPRLVHLEQLQGLWNGRTTVLWRPRTTQLLMRQGTRGEPVRWLRRHLDILKGSDAIEPNDSDQFDAALELQVREFQAGQGLVADGVVGPRTMLILNNLEAVSGVPTLVPIRSESAG
jgi:general secretion pathway protein A